MPNENSSTDRNSLALGRRVSAMIRRLSEMFDRKQVSTGLVLMLIGYAGGAFFGVGPAPSLPWQRVTELRPAEFLPDNWRVLDLIRVDMDGRGQPEAVLTALSPSSGPLDRPTGTVMVLAWDDTANRWTVVFDASKRRLPGSVNTAQPFFDEREPTDLRVVTLESRPGRADVAFSANLASGAGTPGQVVGIVRFEREIAELMYHFAAFGSGTIKSVGPRGHQRLRVRTMYYTDIDGHCCPVRDYTFEIAENPEHAYYESVSDDRGWLGAYVTSHSESGGLVVGGVFPGSPAAAQLRRGDRIAWPGGRGDDLFHAIGKKRPGDSVGVAVSRNGTQTVKGFTLASRVDEARNASHVPRVPDVGFDVIDFEHGPVVHYGYGQQQSSTPEIPEGSMVVAIDETDVRGSGDVVFLLSAYSPGDEILVTVQTPDGSRREIRVKSGWPIHEFGMSLSTL